MEIKNVVSRLAEIKEQQKQLKAESEKLQAFIQASGEDALKDTKNKSVSYTDDNGNKVTVTISDTVSEVAPSLYHKIFGEAYSDYVKEKTKYDLTDPAKRLISAIWNQEYCSGSIDEIVNALPADDKAKKSLLKKLKGVNFNTDKKNLMNYGGISESEASDYAYMVSEITAWNSIDCLLHLNETDLDDIVKNINAAVAVTRATKLTIESAEV